MKRGLNWFFYEKEIRVVIEGRGMWVVCLVSLFWGLLVRGEER